MTLAELGIRQKGVIVSINTSPDFKKKLMELGLFPGQVVEIIQDAPFGGPLKVKVKDYCLALRREEAKGIEVKKIEE